PVKVENTCLLKAPVRMVPGLPPLVQIDDSTDFSRASVKAICVPSVRVPVPSAAAGSAAPPAVPLDVFDTIPDSTARLMRGVEELARSLAGWVPDRLASRARLSWRPFRIPW